MDIPKILIVEDDAAISTAVAERISFEGWKAIVVGNGNAAIEEFDNEVPDAVLLDIMLPGIDGFGVIRAIRAKSTVPIIMLTARNSAEDEVQALEMGADDFLTKPLRPSLLIAHIKVWLKRYEHIKKVLETEHKDIINAGRLTIDQNKRTVTIDGDKVVTNLTPTEFTLLITLVASADEAVSRKELLARVWGWHDVDSTRTVDSHTKTLRQKIGHDIIKTVHGVGYKYNLSGE